MYVLYEDAGKLKTAKIFSEAESTLQIESASGKRSKIKRNITLFNFDSPEPDTLLEQAKSLAETLDIDFLWECAPQEEFKAAELANEYFGYTADTTQKTAMIMALSSAPAYFHRRGKGSFKPAPPDILKAALAAIEKKRLQAEQQKAWTDTLLAGQLPEGFLDTAKDFLDKPDKNSLQWKALDAAIAQSPGSAEEFLLDLGVWPNQLVMMRELFFKKHFAQGINWPNINVPALDIDLPKTDVIAYSIDDANTTEIDDAISFQNLDSESISIGIHIAVPSLLITRDNEIDKIARRRMSTVYMPGEKIPMLPEQLVTQFSLIAGSWRPCLSLYIKGNPSTGELIESETKLEQIQVKENLRHDDFGLEITEHSLNDETSDLAHKQWLAPLWKFASVLNNKRAQVRGRPENNDRIEYTFVLDGPADNPDSIINLIPRKRNSPLDLLIAEYMILANTVWGALLAKHGVPGIYRSQHMGRTRMSTQALPHESIGVAQYIWSTSPLRRYVDLVNQSQIIAAAEHGVSARLAAPYKPKDADLFALIGAFDAQYSAYGEFQSAIERYWCLRWLQQNNIEQINAHLIRDNLVRFTRIPFITRINGLPELERGQEIILDILGYDELNLEIDCRLRTVV